MSAINELRLWKLGAWYIAHDDGNSNVNLDIGGDKTSGISK